MVVREARRRGRPSRGSTSARERLLDAARGLFPERGYSGATLRMIAERAGCDVALVAYHFGSKRALFAEAMTIALGPASVLDAAIEGPRDEMPQRLVAMVIRAWERPEVQASLVTLVRTGLQHPEVLRAFREYLEAEIYDRLAGFFDGAGASERATATMTVIVGVVFGRYVIELEPLRSMRPEKLFRSLEPSLRAISTPRRSR